MNKLDLSGKWQLRSDENKVIDGYLPGCTYLDYIANGMEDPFWGENETEAKKLAQHDYRYSRDFVLTKQQLDNRFVEFVCDGLDTLCSIYVNDKLVAKTNNINRVWRIDVKSFCVEGTNHIDLDFENPYTAVEKMQVADPIPSPSSPIMGVGHLRKTVCHFGWDWGPSLPTAGITRSVAIEAYDIKIRDIKILQHHNDGKVELEVTAKIDSPIDTLVNTLTITSPSGKLNCYEAVLDSGTVAWKVQVEDVRLWWCNGLGEQPLYKVEVSTFKGEKLVDSLTRQIGLRTIKLDTSEDALGHQFRFIINGVSIFAKGANWIPADSFITRADKKTIDFYINAAKRSNMNMLRVWGGGTFETEDFYDACDRDGILVWQDCLFACNSYPLYDEKFLENVHAEVKDNVERLRHRASLALWCGNNENELFSMLWKKGSKMATSNPNFYHNVLRSWINELDEQHDYWPGSPSSGSLDYKMHNMKKGKIRGDTHLWNIWHGMRPIEAFRQYPTRFCSEYGMESMPSMHTISTFTDNKSPELFDSVMKLHQKCGGGNEKMLFYLLAKYRNPEKFEDFIYLSQLVQANTIRFATDCWRRKIGEQNGAIFWQLNDCWPVASWAGIDYEKQQKAVIYQAKHFNKMLCLSNDYYNDRVELYVVNEYPQKFDGRIEWTINDFNGKVINSGASNVSVGGVSSVNACVLKFNKVLKGFKKSQVTVTARLIDGKEVRDEKDWLLVPDKKAKLPIAKVKQSCVIKNGVATVTLTSDSYARYVFLEVDGVTAPWSDNFFNIPAGGKVTVTVQVDEGMTSEIFESKLKIKTLTDVKAKNGLLKDKCLKMSMFMKKKNLGSWILFKILLG